MQLPYIGGPNIHPRNTMILILGTPKKVPLISENDRCLFGNPQNDDSRVVGLPLFMEANQQVTAQQNS